MQALLARGPTAFSTSGVVAESSSRTPPTAQHHRLLQMGSPSPCGAISGAQGHARTCKLVAGSSILGTPVRAFPLSSRQAVSCRGSRQLRVQAGADTAHPGEEREGSGQREFSSFMAVPSTGMAKFGGQLSGGGATLEKSKLDLSRETKTWDAKTDDSGGGGAGGKGIINGGGGDGDDGDDDDYFDDFGEGDGDEGGDDGFFRAAVGQLYDEASRTAVLQEWFRTMADLPIMLRQAAQFGLLSSAQLVRFFSMDVRPNLTRFVTRSMPVSASRGVVGRVMADPAFMQKVAIEQMITVVGSLYWEYRARGERFWKELDLVAIDTVTLQAANLAAVWLVSPTRSYGVPHKYDWQRMLHDLPANVFDASGPQRQYTVNARVAGLLAKAAELCAVGMLAGGAMSGLQTAAVKLRQLADPEWTPSVEVPDFWRSSCGMAASLGVATNMRYQLIAGADRWLFDHGKYLASYLASSTMLRAASNRLGEGTRLYLQGLPLSFPQQSAQQQQRPVLAQRPAAGSSPAAPRKVKKVKKAKKHAVRGFEMSVAAPSAAAAGAQ